MLGALLSPNPRAIFIHPESGAATVDEMQTCRKSDHLHRVLTKPLAACIVRRRAFTLVELLVVIGIIALLISILLPVLAKARESAREVRCESNLRQLGIGLQMYCDANKGYLPFDSNSGSKSNPIDAIPTSQLSASLAAANSSGLPLGWSGAELWFNAIPPMLNLPAYYDQISVAPAAGGAPVPTISDGSVYICPSCNALTIASNETSNVVVSNNSYFLVYGDPPANRGSGKYVKAQTVQLPVCMCYVPNSQILSKANPRPKLSQLSPASNVAAFVEKRMSPGEINQSDLQYNALWNTPFLGSGNTIASEAMGQLSSSWSRFGSRHRNGGYICFADGHVGWYSLDQVCFPPNVVAGIDDYNDPANVIWNPFGAAK